MALDIHFKDKVAKVQRGLKTCPNTLSYWDTQLLNLKYYGTLSQAILHCGRLSCEYGTTRQHHRGSLAASLASTH